MPSDQTDNATGTTPTDAEMLSAVRRAMADYALGGGQRTISIGGVTFAYASLDDLLRLETLYASRVRMEEAVNSGGCPWAIRTRMGA